MSSVEHVRKVLSDSGIFIISEIPDNYFEYIPDYSIDQCWPWLGLIAVNGYGFYWDRTHGKRLAHRLMAEMTLGNPAGKFVLHSCDFPACCNPAHLRIADHHENMRDMDKRGRRVTPAGERGGHAILTEKDVLEIRREAARGVSLRALAKRMGMSASAIHQAASGRTWKCVKLSDGKIEEVHE